MKLKKFKIQGMHCKNCEKIIAKKALSLEGIKSINVDYAAETAEVEYNPKIISEEKIEFDIWMPFLINVKVYVHISTFFKTKLQGDTPFSCVL